MIIKEWTKEWYQVLSAEQISDILVKAKESFENSARWDQNAAKLMWGFRVETLQKEMSARVNEKEHLKIA